MALTTPFLQDLLRSVLIDLGLNPESKYECQQICAKLLSSSLYRVKVNTGPSKTRDFIFKVQRDEPKIMEFCFSPVMFKNEDIFFTKVVGAFDKFLKEKPENIPQCYKTKCEGYNVALVFEDMEAKGFVSVNRLKTLEPEEISIVMKELGHFHAFSLALKNKYPNVFNELKESTVTESQFFPEKINKSVGLGFRFTGGEIIKLMKKRQSLEPQHINKFETFLTEHPANHLREIIQPREEDEPYNIFTHGDLWVNNLLFRYNNDNAEKVCFLDFQMCRYGSLALDVSAVLMLLMDQKMRDTRRNEMLKVYHQSACEKLLQLGCDPDKVFPFKDLLNQLFKYSGFNLGMTLLFPFWLDEGEDGEEEADWDVGEEGTALPLVVMGAALQRMTESCFQRIVDVVKDSIERGYL